MTERGIRNWAGRVAARRGAVLALSVLGGLLAALGQAPFDLPITLFAGLALGFLIWRHTPTLSLAAWAGWGLGLGYFGLVLIWIVEPFLVDAPRYGWMAPFALVLMAGGLALFWGLAAVMARFLTPARWGWLGWAAAMSAAELARGVVFTGFPWGGPGQALVSSPLGQVASLVGAEGLSFVVFLASAGLASIVAGRGREARLAGAAALVAGIAGAYAFGHARLSQAPPQRAAPLTLRLVQPNAPQHLKWHPDHAWTYVERMLEFTAAPPDMPGRKPDLVIWPETAVPDLIDRQGALLAEIGGTASGPVALGILERADGRYYNLAVVIDEAGRVIARYRKHHLVPFGEYMPLGELFARLGISGLAASGGYGYSPGSGAAVLDLGRAGKVLPLICYEAIFARDLRAAPERADWILQITNDAWFGTFSGPYQHFAQARMRAIEFGLPLVRVANTGISALIDAYGRAGPTLGLGETGHVDVALPGALPPTFYARQGDAPLIALLAALLAGLAVRRVRFSV